MEKLADMGVCQGGGNKGGELFGKNTVMTMIEGQDLKMKELNSDFSNFSTNASQKMSLDKKWLRKAKRIPKFKELTPVHDLENDDGSSGAEDDSKSCGSAKVYFELGAMAAIEMPEDLFMSDKESEKEEEQEQLPQRPFAILNLDLIHKKSQAGYSFTQPSTHGNFSKLHEQIINPSDDSDDSNDF